MGEETTSVADDVEECLHHDEGEEFSTFVAIDEEYATLGM